MFKLSGTLKVLTWILLVTCVLVLTKNILFKRSPRFYKDHFRKDYSVKVIKQRWKKANKKPFYTIGLFYRSRRMNPVYRTSNLAGNIVGFIPLGIFLPLLFWRLRKGWKTVCIIFLISLCFELTQLIFGLGVFDVDDLILNTTGGLLGFVFYWFIYRIWKHYKKPYTPIIAEV